MSANLIAAVRIANDLLMTYQAVQQIANGAAMTGRDMSDAELARVKELARQAGADLDEAIAKALDRRERRVPVGHAGVPPPLMDPNAINRS